jgi:hypothetical protein
MTRADFEGADLRGADLSKARSLTAGQVVTAEIDLDTVLPPDVIDDEHVRARVEECLAQRRDDTDGTVDA